MAQCEEVLGGIIEASEVPKRSDSTRRFGVEEAGGDGLIDKETEIVRVDILIVDLLDSRLIASAKPIEGDGCRDLVGKGKKRGRIVGGDIEEGEEGRQGG